jgi:predicted nucleic acid-binding protein
VSGALPPHAVLDSDVLFSRVLYELFGRAAATAGLLTLLWSDELLVEAKRALIERKALTEAVADRWVGYLRQSFPDGRVEIAARPAGVELSAMTIDPGDEHVCALAIAGRADLLITFDRGYLNEPLRAHGVHVIEPDDFLAAAFEEHPTTLQRILDEQTSSWGGGRPLPDLLDALERARAGRFVALVRASLG